MAELPVDLSASNPQPKKGILRKIFHIKPKSPKSAEPLVIDFSRDKIMEEAPGTRGIIEEHGRRKEGMVSERVGITEALRQEHVAFLKSYVKGLSRVYKEDESLLHHQGHEQDLQMWELLSTNMEPDQAKIDKFLSEPEGIIISTQIMDVEMAKRFAIAGKMGMIKPTGERGEKDPQSVTTGEDQGPLNKWFSEKVGEPLDKLVWLAGGRSNADKKLLGSQHLGKFIGNIHWRDFVTFGAVSSPAVGYAIAAMGALPFGLAAPAVFGAEAAVGVVIPYLFRGGVKIDRQWCEEAFNHIKGDPNEAKFMKLSTGIDVNRWDFTVGSKSDFKENQQFIDANPDTSKDVTKAVVNEAMSMYYTRFNTLVSLGVPRHRIDANSLQAVIKNSQPEKTDLEGHRRIREEYKRGGIPTHAWARMQKYYEASSKVTAQMIEEYIASKPQIDFSRENAKRITEQKIIDFQEGGARVAKKKAELGEKKIIAEADKNILDSRKQNIEQYKSTKEVLNTAKGEVGKKFPGVSPTITGIEAEIIIKNNFIIDPTVAGSIAARRSLMEAAITVAMDAEAVGVTPALYPGNTRATEIARRQHEVSKRYEGRKKALDEEEKIVSGKITLLGELKTAIETAEESLSDGEDVVKNLEQVIDGLNTDFTSITSWNTVGGVSLTQADLITEDIDELNKRANTVYTADNTKGWPPNRNNRSEIRARIINAKIEAVSQQKEAVDPTFVVRNPNFITVRGFNISENQLRVLSRDQIMELVNKHHATTAGIAGWDAAQNGNPANIAIVQEAIQQAVSRLKTRADIIDQGLKSTEGTIKDLDEEITTFNFNKEVNKLEVTKTLMERQGSIYSNTKTFFDKSASVANFATIPTTGDGFSEVEVALGAPKGYLDMMDLFFDYRNRADRAEYFKTITDALPPQNTAVLLANYLGMGYGPHTINTVLSAIHGAITASPPTMDYRDMRQAFKNIINKFNNDALLLAA